MQETNFTYPVMLDLKNKKCVLIGGGQVALRKALTLIESEAQLTVIAPSVTAELNVLAENKLLVLEERAYTKGDLSGAFLTIAATDDFALNRQIASEAPFLCNVVTEPALGNFTVPKTVTSGNLVFTISTTGMPALTKALAQDLQKYYPEDFSLFNDFLKNLRQELQAFGSPNMRTAFWRQCLTPEVLELVHNGKLLQAKEIITNAANRFRAQS